MVILKFLKKMFWSAVFFITLCSSAAFGSSPLFHAEGSSFEAGPGFFLPEYQETTFIYFEKKNHTLRSKVTFCVERTKERIPVQYTISSRGQGQFSEYDRVSWESVATVEARDGILYPLHSQGIVREADTKTVLISKEKDFDYDREQIIYKFSYSRLGVSKEIVFPLKGLTVDSATLPFVLRSILAKGTPVEDITFYALTESENLYRIALKAWGSEELSLPLGKAQANKYQLIPQLGALTWLGRMLGPPTYMWFSVESPYDWLQYEGYEVDFASLQILGQAQSLSPAPGFQFIPFGEPSPDAGP